MSPGKRRREPLKQANTEPRFQGIQTPKRSRMVDIERFGGAGEAVCPMHRQHKLGFVPVLHDCKDRRHLQFRK